MHELPLLINIAVALVVAFFGGMAARYVGLPTLVGYMLAGIAIGPFTPGFVGDIETISQLAELGVIFLMFGVGLHFSLGDLWRVRDIAIPGAIGQMLLATLLGYGLTQMWGWSQSASLVLGLAISVASTVVLLRGLMDNGLLNTPHGQAAVGWLVLEDIATVLILLLLPAVASGDGGFDWSSLTATLVKAAAFVLILLFIGRKVIPWILTGVARTGSRELFILAVLAISVGTALAATEIFSVSLALGAFVAGVVVSESEMSHQASADLLPFREAFTIVFFVSIGMLANVNYLLDNIGAVLALVAVITVGKYVITLLLAVFIKRPALTFLTVAAGLSQIGEFSFILGQAGLSAGLLDRDQYSLILAGALISITVNPLMYRVTGPAERLLKKSPRLWKLLDRHNTPPLPEKPPHDHVVIVGSGRVGKHVVNLLNRLNVPFIVVELDAVRADKLSKRGVVTLYGDAGSSEVIVHAGLADARLMVVTTPEDISTGAIIAAARKAAPDLPIVARASTADGVQQLADMGAHYVVHPEAEGGLQIVRRTLLELGYSVQNVQKYTDAVRSDLYDTLVNTNEEQELLQDLVNAANSLGLRWLHLEPGSPMVGKTLATTRLRAQTGASIVAIRRGQELMANPQANTTLQAGDHVGLIGDDEQLHAAEKAAAALGLETASPEREDAQADPDLVNEKAAGE